MHPINFCNLYSNNLFKKYSPVDVFIDLREREMDCLPVVCVPNQSSNAQPSYVPGLEIEPTTFWCRDDAPTN